MSRVRCRNTKPELFVRRLVFSMGYRYRLHDRRLPGTPDLVFRGRRKVVFVHGCMWHQHDGCGRVPKSRQDFWVPKLRENKRRDTRQQRALRLDGWGVLVIWECQLRNQNLARRIERFLEGT